MERIYRKLTDVRHKKLKPNQKNALRVPKDRSNNITHHLNEINETWQ